MSLLLAVDGSSVFMRALAVLPEDKRTVKDLEYMVVSILRRAIRVTRPTHLVVALDTTEQCWRYDVHPEYKSKRQYSDLRPKQLTPMLVPRLQARHIALAYNPEMEADDLLATLAHKVSGHGSEMLCYTRDSDLLSLSDLPGVRILWPGQKGALDVMDREQAAAKLGHTPAHHNAVRALVADRKDDLRSLLGDLPDGWRCPLHKPRAATMLANRGGDLFSVLADAAGTEEQEDMRDKERAYMAEFTKPIAQIWHVATLRTDATLGISAEQTNLQLADLRDP